MSMPTPDQIRAAFPQFVDLSDAVINAAIGLATPEFNDPGRYGDYLANAQNYCVAFFVAENQPDRGLDRGTNDMVSEKRATLEIHRDPKLVEGQANDPFMKNSYGQMYRYYQSLAGMGGTAAVLSPAVVLPDCLWSG